MLLMTSYQHYFFNTYTKPEVEALISNINLTEYYAKNEIDTSLSDYSTISYLQGNYMTSLLIHKL